MDALAGPLHLVALVLVVSGALKLVAPRPAAEAMRAAGLPVPAGDGGLVLAGTALGTVEAASGLLVLAVPRSWIAAWVGAFYLALAAFVVRLRRRDPGTGCGCFGASTTPPGVAHVVVDVAAAVVALTAAASGVPDVVDVLGRGVGAAVPYVVLLAVGTGLVLLTPSLLSDLDRVVDEPRRFGGVR